MSHVSKVRGVDEAGLLERARNGDEDAFEELVMLHADRLFATLRSFGLDESEAQDVAQETFLRAWRAISSFEGRSQFSTWLYRIGFNEAQRRLSRRPPRAAQISTDEQPLERIADQSPGPASQAQTEELRVILRQALREIPVELRAPVVLRDVEGLSTREAASVLDLGEAAFKSRLHRGRLALRALLAPWVATAEL